MNIFGLFMPKSQEATPAPQPRERKPRRQRFLVPGILVQHRETGRIARVLPVIPDPMWIEGVHAGKPELVLYCSPDDASFGDTWYLNEVVAA